MSEQSRAFLSDRDHSLLIDIFYKLIGNSEDPAEVQSIESLIQMNEESGNGSEISDADVRHTISLVCKYCQMLSEQKHANDNLVDFYANSLNKLQIRYEQAIQDHRRLEEDQIKIYQDYDNLTREHLCLYRRFEKLHKKQLKGIQWVKKWIDRGRKHDDSRCN